MVDQGEETICIHGVLIMCEPQCHDHHYNYHYLCLYHHRRHHCWNEYRALLSYPGWGLFVKEKVGYC